MNYLAHLYLSGNNTGFIIGNYIADHVRGKKVLLFDEDIRKGIVLHRKIDHFTDHHPDFIISRDRLTNSYGKFSGVIVDMFYDHFLSANWNDFSEEPILNFTERMYSIIAEKEDRLPEKSRRVLKHMSATNWLVSYGTIEGIGRALTGMSGRIPYKSNLEYALHDLEMGYGLFRDDFYRFFPALVRFSSEERNKLLHVTDDHYN